jgi:hypothetical protein
MAMAGEVDRSVEEGLAVLREIFCRLQLSPEEKAFVNNAGRTIAEHSFELLTSLPEKEAKSLRPIVMAVAIACIIGPPEPGDFGVDILASNQG